MTVQGFDIKSINVSDGLSLFGVDASGTLDASNQTQTKYETVTIVVEGATGTNNDKSLNVSASDISLSVDTVSINDVSHNFQFGYPVTSVSYEEIPNRLTITVEMRVKVDSSKFIQIGSILESVLTVDIDGTKDTTGLKTSITTYTPEIVNDNVILNGQPIYDGAITPGNYDSLIAELTKELDLSFNTSGTGYLKVLGYKNNFKVDISGIRFNRFNDLEQDSSGNYTGLYNTHLGVTRTNLTLNSLLSNVAGYIDGSVPGYYKITYHFKDEVGNDINIDVSADSSVNEVTTFEKEIILNIPIGLHETYDSIRINNGNVEYVELSGSSIALPTTYSNIPNLSLTSGSYGFGDTLKNVHLMNHLKDDIITVSSNDLDITGYVTYEEYGTELVDLDKLSKSSGTHSIEFKYDLSGSTGLVSTFFEKSFKERDISRNELFDEYLSVSGDGNLPIELIKTSEISFTVPGANKLKRYVGTSKSNMAAAIARFYDGDFTSGTDISFVGLEHVLKVSSYENTLFVGLLPLKVDLSNGEEVIDISTSQVIYQKFTYTSIEITNGDISSVAVETSNNLVLDPQDFSYNFTTSIVDAGATDGSYEIVQIDTEGAVKGQIQIKQGIFLSDFILELNPSSTKISQDDTTFSDVSLNIEGNSVATLEMPTMKTIFDLSDGIIYSDAVDGSYNLAEDVSGGFLGTTELTKVDLCYNLLFTQITDSSITLDLTSNPKKLKDIYNQRLGEDDLLSNDFSFNNATDKTKLLFATNVVFHLKTTNSTGTTFNYKVNYPFIRLKDPNTASIDASSTSITLSNLDFDAAYITGNNLYPITSNSSIFKTATNNFGIVYTDEYYRQFKVVNYEFDYLGLLNGSSLITGLGDDNVPSTKISYELTHYRDSTTTVSTLGEGPDYDLALIKDIKFKLSNVYSNDLESNVTDFTVTKKYTSGQDFNYVRDSSSFNSINNPSLSLTSSGTTALTSLEFFKPNSDIPLVEETLTVSSPFIADNGTEINVTAVRSENKQTVTGTFSDQIRGLTNDYYVSNSTTASYEAKYLTKITEPPTPKFVGSDSTSIVLGSNNSKSFTPDFIKTILDEVDLKIWDGKITTSATSGNILTATVGGDKPLTHELLKELNIYFDNSGNSTFGDSTDLCSNLLSPEGLLSSGEAMVRVKITETGNEVILYRYGLSAETLSADDVFYGDVSGKSDISLGPIINEEETTLNSGKSILMNIFGGTSTTFTYKDNVNGDITIENTDIKQEMDRVLLKLEIDAYSSGLQTALGSSVFNNNPNRNLYTSTSDTVADEYKSYDIPIGARSGGTTNSSATATWYKLNSINSSDDTTVPLIKLEKDITDAAPVYSYGGNTLSDIDISLGSNTIEIRLGSGFVEDITLNDLLISGGNLISSILELSGINMLEDRAVAELEGYDTSLNNEILGLSRKDLLSVYLTSKTLDGSYVYIENSIDAASINTAIRDAVDIQLNKNLVYIGLSKIINSENTAQTYYVPRSNMAWQLVPENDLTSSNYYTHVYGNIKEDLSFDVLPVGDGSVGTYPFGTLTDASYEEWYHEHAGLEFDISGIDLYTFNNDVYNSSNVSTSTLIKHKQFTDATIGASNFVSFDISESTLNSKPVVVSQYYGLGNKTYGLDFESMLRSVKLNRNRPGKYKFIIYFREGSDPINKNDTAGTYNLTGNKSLDVLDFNNQTSFANQYSDPGDVLPSDASNVELTFRKSTNSTSLTSWTILNVNVIAEDHDLSTMTDQSNIDMSLQVLPNQTSTPEYYLVNNNTLNKVLFNITGDLISKMKLDVSLNITVRPDYYDINETTAQRLATTTYTFEISNIDVNGLDVSSGIVDSDTSGFVMNVLDLEKLLITNYSSTTNILPSDVSGTVTLINMLDLSNGPADVSFVATIRLDERFINDKTHSDVTTLDGDGVIAGLTKSDATELSPTAGNTIVRTTDGTKLTLNTSVNVAYSAKYIDTTAPVLKAYSTGDGDWVSYLTVQTRNGPYMVGGYLRDVNSDDEHLVRMSDANYINSFIDDDATNHKIVITNVRRINKNSLATDNLYNLTRSLDSSYNGTDETLANLNLFTHLNISSSDVDASSTTMSSLILGGQLRELGISADLVDANNVVQVEYVGYYAEGMNIVRTEPIYVNFIRESDTAVSASALEDAEENTGAPIQDGQEQVGDTQASGIIFADAGEYATQLYQTSPFQRMLYTTS